jgi:hypothetical protein
MGHRIIQRILECAVCGEIPDDGQYMWEMGAEYWCEKCCICGETPDDDSESRLLSDDDDGW